MRFHRIFSSALSSRENVGGGNLVTNSSSPFFSPKKKKNFSCLRMLFSTRADIFGPVQRCEKVLRYYYYLVATLISSDISETYLYLESINSYLKLRINHCTLQRSNNLFSTEISSISITSINAINEEKRNDLLPA